MQVRREEYKVQLGFTRSNIVDVVGRERKWRKKEKKQHRTLQIFGACREHGSTYDSNKQHKNVDRIVATDVFAVGN